MEKTYTSNLYYFGGNNDLMVMTTDGIKTITESRGK